MKNKVYLILTIIIALVACLLLFIFKKGSDPVITPTTGDNNNFDYKMISEVNNTLDDNFMISPVSIAYALSMLKDGANNNTKMQIENVLNNYKLPKIANVKNRISLANLIFINTSYKSDISKNYIKLLQNNYDSDLMFDKLNSPDKINKWISDKTYKMIDKCLPAISPQTVLGLANAIAIDLKWNNTFECDNTKEQSFNLKDGTKITTPMMHGSNDVYYIESDNAKGIIKDYMSYNTKTGEETYEKENAIELEYIAILPKTNIDEYKSVFNEKELKQLLESKRYANESLDINYGLPKYTFDFDYEKFKDSLINMGITDAFDPENASFKNMLDNSSTLRLYVSDAIHKSHIELNEYGTKAAAVTVFMLRDNALPFEKDKEIINITFDSPFIFIIKEKESDNIWFYGTVYKPMEYKNNTKCETKSE